MSLQLRPYQDDLLAGARAHFTAGVRNVCIQLPTGGGKTAITAKMFQTASGSKGLRCAFGVHRAELVRQAARTFDKVGIDYGIVSPDHPQRLDAPVQIISIPTWLRRADRLGRFDFVAWDEAHHVAARTWASLHEGQPDAYHIGLTATPQRLDGTGLRGWFSQLVCGPQPRWLIEQGFLSRYRYFEPSVPVLDADGKTAIVADPVSKYLKIAGGRKALYFCKSVQHSKDTAAAFTRAGVPAAHVDADTETDQRLAIMDAFEAGRILVLCNRDLFGEGVDVPGIQCIGLLRKTESLSLYLQWIGRGLRPKPDGGDCIVLDHAGNRGMHGMPDDERTWTLDGCMGRLGDGEAPIKRCPVCFTVVSATASKCECGHHFVAAEVGQVRTVDGDLQEVEAEMLRKQQRQQQGMATTNADLIAVYKQRAMAQGKDPDPAKAAAWANFVMQSRARKRRGRSFS